MESLVAPAPEKSLVKVCFNLKCNEVTETTRKGWSRRAGGFVDLCDRCASAYDDAKFCETFHMDASGWRNCERCKKSIHCGCIVSFHKFVLLDAGGILCLTCASKNYILTPNPAWPQLSRGPSQASEILNDSSVNSWNRLAGSGPVPWRQAPSLSHASTAQSKLPQGTTFEVQIPGGIDRLLSGEQLNHSLLDNQEEGSSERLKIGVPELLRNGLPELRRANGFKYDGQPTTFSNVFQQSTPLMDGLNNSCSSSPVISRFKNLAIDQTQVSGVNVLQSTPPNSLGKHFTNSNGTESSAEAHTRKRKPQAESCGKNQPLSQSWPKVTDQELQQISGESNYKVTFLFEKMLSASDTGRIGRLVLPKKSAEAHLPEIPSPEGLPLKVQDIKGNDWTFQFRFWPNNNSRMYVLEGVTPLFQSLQLQAGDKVTFSRTEPEGRLIMGYRKASTASPSDQINENVSSTSGVPTNCDLSSRGGDVTTKNHSRVNSPLALFTSSNRVDTGNTAGTWRDVDKSAYIAKEVSGPKVTFRNKRKKNSTMALKSKRVRCENDEMNELKVTWIQAQDLLRPAPDIAPTIMHIEGAEFEEYEQEPPVIGRPTIFTSNSVGENVQWVQCEDCWKWRKIPADADLPSRWTCSKSQWNSERSFCSADEELTTEELDNLFPGRSWATSNKKKAAKLEPDLTKGFVEGLDGLAELAIQEDGETASLSQATTTKHPRHKPGCTCIVCIQPPSGKGQKHNPSCMCPICSTMKRRLDTLMLRRGQKNLEKAEKKKKHRPKSQGQPEDDDDGDDHDDDEDVIAAGLSAENGNNSQSHNIRSDEGSDEESNKRKMSGSPLKSQAFDLNIQPEREDELSSPASLPMGMMWLLRKESETYIRKRKLSHGSPVIIGSPVNSQTEMVNGISQQSPEC